MSSRGWRESDFDLEQKTSELGGRAVFSNGIYNIDVQWTNLYLFLINVLAFAPPPFLLIGICLEYSWVYQNMF